jgi:hypothetical protein
MLQVRAPHLQHWLVENPSGNRFKSQSHGSGSEKLQKASSSSAFAELERL